MAEIKLKLTLTLDKTVVETLREAAEMSEKRLNDWVSGKLVRIAGNYLKGPKPVLLRNSFEVVPCPVWESLHEVFAAGEVPND